MHRSATHCSTFQRTATHCNALQHTATHCHTLPHTASTHWDESSHVQVCSTLQHTATHAILCNTLQHAATHCTTLQHSATHYNTPLHTVRSLFTSLCFPCSPPTEELGLEIITTAKISNEFSRDAPYISNTFSRDSPKFQAHLHVSKRSPQHSQDLT